MKLNDTRILVCDCQHSMPLDPRKLQRALQAVGAEGEPEIETSLCRAQLANYEGALADGAPVCVACTQEAPLFRDVAEETAPEAALAFANIREKAGWSAEARQAHPKIAALLAAGTAEPEPAPAVEMTSEGSCLVYGRGQQALDIARQLGDRLEVTVLLSDPEDAIPPRLMDIPVFKGRIRSLAGHLGAFSVTVDDYAPALPASKATLEFELGRNNAQAQCDIVLDLSGGAPLVPAPETRDGYLRPDPGDPAAVQKAAFEAAGLVGTFEKPRYVHYDAAICVHARSRKIGCTNCLDNCPTGAITSADDQVAIDPYICAGCGNCASVCPTGAASYQLPGPEDVLGRLRSLVTSYLTAGGERPVLLVHDPRHGEDVISLMARFGRGLPAQVLPLQVNEATQIGLDFTAAAFAYGVAELCVLVPPDKDRKGELEGLRRLRAQTEAVLAGLGYGDGRMHILDDADPETIEATLYGLDTRSGPTPGSFLAMGGKRSRALLGLRHLQQQAPDPQDILPMPEGTPFGRVHVDTAGCTMCLACVSACPTGAMLDDPDSPWLGFQEEACVQCGLCRETCPESVISLEPRLNFTDDARRGIELNRQEPFHCVRCGKPFGVEPTIRRIAAQLSGKHWMFQGSQQVERIMMCDDCRVIDQFDDPDAPLQAGTRPRPRTTEDDLRAREAARKDPSGSGNGRA